jgi:RNA polymerase sigma-70 factor (ECF subfamily)
VVVLISSEPELVDRLRAGDEQAFAELVERHHPALIRLARAFVANAEAAEDVAQETWIALLAGIEAFEGRSSIRTWLYQVCANRARSYGTREHRTVPVESIEPVVDAEQFAPNGAWTSPVAPWPGELASATRDAALVEEIRLAILQLPPLQQTVVTMRDVDGLTGRQVCAILEITEANQRVLLHRGRERIRRGIGRAVITR